MPAEEPYARPSRANYGFAVQAAGGEAHYTLNDLALLDDYLARCDGWIVSGGSDVDPAIYGGNPNAPGLDECDTARDAFELALIPRLLARKVPSLYICRGIQVLNVALGGSLIEDIPSDPAVQSSITHAQHRGEPPIPRDRALTDHVVRVAPESRLAAALGCTELRTNSLHHQALRAVAPSLRVTATTADGIVEGVDGPADQPFCIAVQWHPEALADAPSRALFAALVNAALL